MSIRHVAALGWMYAKHGPPKKVLQMEKYRIPFDRCGSDVVVKMLAAPVHPHDRHIIEGVCRTLRPQKFPAVAGAEGIGIVEEVGAKADSFVKEGDMVWINNPCVGTFTTHLVTAAANLDVVPNTVDVELEFLASLSLFHTAFHITNDFVHLKSGDVVLQTGASSAVSQICQSLVRARGAKLLQTLRGGRTNHSELVSFYKGRGAFAVVPPDYTRTNYMKRLISDLPAPKLLLNHAGGPIASHLVNLIGDGGTCVSYGNVSNRSMHVANMDVILRGITFKHFFLPLWMRENDRATRAQVQKNVLEAISVTQGHAAFRAERYKMDGDSAFAFATAWDSPLASRKPVLRMVGEYGEWRPPSMNPVIYETGRAIWDDLLQQHIEASGVSDQPQSMKYYTPFADFFSTLNSAQECKELGTREIFFKRPHQPRYNVDEINSISNIKA